MNTRLFLASWVAAACLAPALLRAQDAPPPPPPSPAEHLQTQPSPALGPLELRPPPPLEFYDTDSDAAALGPRQGQPPRDEAPDRRDRRPGPPPLTAEQLDQAISVLQRIDPQLAKEFQTAKDENPTRAARELQRRFPLIHRFMELRRVAPVMFDLRVDDLRLNRQTKELSKQLADAQRDDQRTDALREKLRDTVAEHFDIRQQIREHELAQLEKRIEELRDELEQRSYSKDELIDQRMQELTGSEDVAEW